MPKKIFHAPSDPSRGKTTTKSVEISPTASQLAHAEKLLKQCGYERQSDGSYAKTLEAQVKENLAFQKEFEERVWSWDTESYQFRDAVRAGDESALERLENEVFDKLNELGDEFGVLSGAAEWLLNELSEPAKESLIEFIEGESENDAALRKEEELEEIGDLLEEADRTEETPPALSLVSRTGHVKRSAGGAK